jgi:hypothetical protein
MDIKRNISDNRTWNPHSFLDISSVDNDKLVPSLYHSVEIRSIEVFLIVVSATSAPSFRPLRHQGNVCHVSRPSCEPLYAINSPDRKQETFLYEYSLYWVLFPIKNRRTEGSFWQHTHQARWPFWLLTPCSERTHALLLPRLSWS